MRKFDTYPNPLDLNDPKIKRRVIILGEAVSRELYVAGIGASNEVEGLIDIIDKLVYQLYSSGAPAKLRVSE